MYQAPCAGKDDDLRPMRIPPPLKSGDTIAIIPTARSIEAEELTAGVALATQGLVAPEFQIATESSVAGYVNYMQRAIAGNGIGDVRVSYTGLTALAADSSALLAEVNLVLAAGQLSAATLATLKAALDTITATTDAGKLNRVQAALLLVMAAPEYIVQK